MNRSSKPETRNPVLALPGVGEAFAKLPPEAKSAVDLFLYRLSADARVRAEESWRKHKGPMAAYWKAIAVYSRHARQAARTTS